MHLGELFKDFHLENVKLNLKAVQFEVSFRETDKDAAWDLYVEMLTRVVTQPLPPEAGDEQAALESVYSLVPATPVLNQIVRPFTAKWHKESLSGSFGQEGKRLQFRKELESLQVELRNYNRLLAEIASVEDLTDLEDPDGD